MRTPLRPDEQPPRAALVTFRSYEMHARRESQALADQGYDVDVICLRRPDETRSGRDGAIRFTRLSIPKSRGSLARYALSYGSWFALCSLLLTFRHLRRRYDIIQITSLPDHQVFAAAI
ncbi:MAG: glycosyltransferase, partial [Acidimicrobiales bacterium]